MRLRVFWGLIIGTAIGVISGCQHETPSPPPETPPPFFQFTRVSDGTPNIGDMVEVEWQYGQDVDPNFEPTVKRQVVQLQSLTVGGDIFRQTYGCFPTELPFGSEDDECLPLDNRKLEFEFRGPVMLWFMA